MKILIIEDEQSSADRLRRMTEVEHEIVGVCTSNAEVKAFFSGSTQREVDLILSDIQLGDGLSFESLRVNRQYIISAAAVQKLSTYFLGKMRIHMSATPDEIIIVSKDKVATVKRWLDS